MGPLAGSSGVVMTIRISGSLLIHDWSFGAVISWRVRLNAGRFGVVGEDSYDSIVQC